jgi:Barstar (barnase inhibitor)
VNEAIASVLDGSRPPGVYRWLSSAHPATVRRTVARHGWYCHPLDGRRIASKRALLSAVAKAADFPRWFGENWDALADCLDDLSWYRDREPPAQGHLFLYDHHEVLLAADEEAWRQAVEVFGSAAAKRPAGEPPLYLLLRGAPHPDVPLL